MKLKTKGIIARFREVSSVRTHERRELCERTQGQYITYLKKFWLWADRKPATEWKWRTVRTWTENFPRVHVAKVNSERKLWQAAQVGAESCDGTGWMRGGENRIEELERFLGMSTRGDKRPQMVMEGIL